MENQDFIKIIEGLKSAGLVYNDADFCKKVGLSRSHVSEIRKGKKPCTIALSISLMSTESRPRYAKNERRAYL